LVSVRVKTFGILKDGTTFTGPVYVVDKAQTTPSSIVVEDTKGYQISNPNDYALFSVHVEAYTGFAKKGFKPTYKSGFVSKDSMAYDLYLKNMIQKPGEPQYHFDYLYFNEKNTHAALLKGGNPGLLLPWLYAKFANIAWAESYFSAQWSNVQAPIVHLPP
jgi:hypothetical protein